MRREYLAAIFSVISGWSKAVGRGVLDGEELAGIGVVLDVAVGADEQFVAGDKAAAPAGHVEALAGGMEFDADVLRAGRGEEAQRLALEHQRGVGGVVNDDEVVLPGEGDDPGEKLRRGAGAGRIVRDN